MATYTLYSVTVLLWTQCTLLLDSLPTAPLSSMCNLGI